MNTITAQTTATINDGEPLECELVIAQEVEMVRSMYATKPDPRWEHTDANGHFHAFTADGKLPTLRPEQVPCDGACGDPEHTVTRYSCRICGEEIEPGYVPDIEAQTVGTPILGPKSATVTVLSDRLIGQPQNEVTLRVRTEDGELLGVGRIVGVDGEFSSDGGRFVITIAARSLEPRLEASGS